MLLTVFSIILLKNLLPTGNSSDCHEFAHIHEFKIEKIFQINSRKDSEKSDMQANIRAPSADDECQAAQSVFGTALMFVRPTIFKSNDFNFVVGHILKSDLLLSLAELDSRRRPPRIHA